MSSPRSKLVRRVAGSWDTSLFVIATEGALTEPRYFDALKLDGLIENERVKVEIIPTPADNTSSPKYVLDRLVEADERLALKEFDKRWLVLDVDHPNRRGELAQTADEALQRGYQLAVSNPCFEVWLHLHFDEDVPATSECAALKTAVGVHREAHEKQRTGSSPWTREAVTAAVERARKLDIDPEHRWPNTAPGTHVYRLLEALFAFGVRSGSSAH